MLMVRWRTCSAENVVNRYSVFVAASRAFSVRSPCLPMARTSEQLAFAPTAGSGELAAGRTRAPLSRHVRRDRRPAPVATRPDIRVATAPLLTVRSPIAGARMDDGDVAENANADVPRVQATDRDRSPSLFQELPLMDQRCVGIRAQEVVGQNLVESHDIAPLGRRDVSSLSAISRSGSPCASVSEGIANA
jgi:hypothetical protein